MVVCTVNKDINTSSPNRVILNGRRLKALELRVGGYSYGKIGGVLGCSSASAYNLVRYAMEQIVKARLCEARLVPGRWETE